jgi:hypothetical protein
VEPRVSAVEGESAESGEMGFDGCAELRIAAATGPAELENSDLVAVTPCRRNAPSSPAKPAAEVVDLGCASAR